LASRGAKATFSLQQAASENFLLPLTVPETSARWKAFVVVLTSKMPTPFSLKGAKNAMSPHTVAPENFMFFSSAAHAAEMSTKLSSLLPRSKTPTASALKGANTTLLPVVVEVVGCHNAAPTYL
jgi:hypothetical protein